MTAEETAAGSEGRTSDWMMGVRSVLAKRSEFSSSIRFCCDLIVSFTGTILTGISRGGASSCASISRLISKLIWSITSWR